MMPPNAHEPAGRRFASSTGYGRRWPVWLDPDVVEGVRHMRMIGILIAALAAFALRTEAQEAPRLAALDSVDVESIAAVASLFQESHDSVWPGYDLSSQPLLIYRPGQWAIVLNPPEDVAGYGPYPASWPPLGAPALLHPGAIGGLVGQLEFDYQVGSTTTVAIPIADNLPDQPQPRVRALFGFVVHEAFHQFQRSAFRGVDEPSEERYPILDRQNNARAALEMRMLEDAVRAVQRLDSVAPACSLTAARAPMEPGSETVCRAECPCQAHGG
jgi:hypothetical protein